jgi:hypothetical protein
MEPLTYSARRIARAHLAADYDWQIVHGVAAQTYTADVAKPSCCAA